MMKGPQGLPKTCKRQPEFCDPISGIPPTFQALVFYQPEGIPDPPPLFDDVLTLLPHPFLADTFTATLGRGMFTLTFDFTITSLEGPTTAVLSMLENELESYRADAINAPFVGTMPYDTLQQQLNNTIGFGASHFRVLL
jgi:hypothetical protein